LSAWRRPTPAPSSTILKTTLEEALLEVDAIPTATKGHSYTFAPLAPLSTCP
jgi:hypothetical protein